MADNVIIIGIILTVLALIMFFLFKKDYSHEETEEDVYSIDYLWTQVKEQINDLTDTSHVDYSLSKEAARKEEARKLELIKALRTCSYGDLNAKNYVKDYIRKILQRNLGISENKLTESSLLITMSFLIHRIDLIFCFIFTKKGMGWMHFISW